MKKKNLRQRKLRKSELNIKHKSIRLKIRGYNIPERISEHEAEPQRG